LQLEAAVNGLGITLASLPLIQDDLATGRLTCLILTPEWSAQDYLLVSEYREEDALVKAFRSAARSLWGDLPIRAILYVKEWTVEV
jgi:DNA-binding transcriptional LysR family regulator